MRIIKVIIAGLFVTAIFAGGYAFGQSTIAPFQLFEAAGHTPESANEAFQPFWETWQIIHEEYFEQPVDDLILAEGAIEGMLASLGDQNTIYLSPEEEEMARQSFEGNAEGIGALVTEENGEIVIVSPYEGSPAEEAGLLPGDVLLEADGKSLDGLDVRAAAALIRGPAGTTVRLLVKRDDEQFEVEVVRDIIRVSSVRGEILDDNIAYVRLSRFGDNSGQEMADMLDELLAEDRTGLILDLRNNPGGGLDAAVTVADEFLDEGLVLIERFGDGRETRHRVDTNRDNAEDIPLVVLINEGSASASEVIAGAVRDRERGILIGTTSFGKGTVQRWNRLSNGGGVRVTIARWLTPEGTWVHEEGLRPDYTIELPDREDDQFVDSQLQAAIEYLLGNPIMEKQDLSGN